MANGEIKHHNGSDIRKIACMNPKDKAAKIRAPLHLIPPVALVHMAMAMKNGADKYGAYNWRDKKIEYMNYISATMRHLACAVDGEDFDQESSELHLAHAMASMAILIDAISCNKVIDNRPKKGAAPVTLRAIASRQG